MSLVKSLCLYLHLKGLLTAVILKNYHVRERRQVTELTLRFFFFLSGGKKMGGDGRRGGSLGTGVAEEKVGGKVHLLKGKVAKGHRRSFSDHS